MKMFGKGKKKKEENAEIRRTSVTQQTNNGSVHITATRTTTTYERTITSQETRSVVLQGSSVNTASNFVFPPPRTSIPSITPRTPLTDGTSFTPSYGSSIKKPPTRYEPVYERTKMLSAKSIGTSLPTSPIASSFPTKNFGYSSTTPNHPKSSTSALKLSSSYSAIPTKDAQSPTSKTVSPKPRPFSAEVSSSIIPSIPTYDTKGSKRGKVLIINNIAFKGKHERKGAEQDSTRLTKLFTKLKFNVTAKKDLKRSGMESELKKFAADTSLKSHNMMICVVMSHGTNMKDSNGTITQISGIDDELLWVNDILKIFADEKHKHLVGKPKIFIFQCCRGDDELVHTDATPFRPTARSYSDMLIAYSTLPGFVSYRDPVEGSWYIQKLCEVIELHGHSLDIEDILKIVDEEISKMGKTNTQTACYESRGFKKCYLYQN
ncbi:unnamed protein product [Brassicogethes aeneus]|uniref:Caspase-3 n=1 Tax=Brassicogethes aeneus TaxID=1431903 RepID=A0A9P0B673_BRAAE|nr:unnamed protein product [Brassicogethes aeneus]